MFTSKNEISRTPPSMQASSKRKLETEFDENSSDSSQVKIDDSAKKLNLSCRSNSDSMNRTTSMFERNMFETEFKQHLIRINALELDLKHVQNEKEELHFQVIDMKKKHSIELSDLQELKQGLEISLKNAKTNEKLLYSEMEHLRDKADKVCAVSLPEKDKEIKELKEKVQEVRCFFGNTIESPLSRLKITSTTHLDSSHK